MAPVSDVEASSASDGGGGGRGGGGLSREDCVCPVCLEIFMEPVTLPCTHTFCKSCFLESVDKSTLCCPMCRKRVSTWARLHGRNKTLVNERLWGQIQAHFPLQCQRRLSGQDAADEDLAVSAFFPRVCEPGELRQEYEDQVTKLEEEKRTLEEEQRRASEEYIQKLLAEEEELLLEEERRREDDERLARLISQQLNSTPVAQGNVDVAPDKKKEKIGPGQIDRFLCPIGHKRSGSDSGPASSFMANKENILLSQVKLTSSSSAEHPLPERPLPELDYYGAQTDRPEPPILHPPSLSDTNPDCSFIRCLYRDAGPSSSSSSSTKRKSSELEEEEEETVSKRGCHALPSTSSSLSLRQQASGGGSAAHLVQEITEREVSLLSRRQQEVEDRRLALLLQKEFNEEEKQRATDRTKGSDNAYPLREKRRDATETKTPTRRTPGRSASLSSANRKTPETTSTSSSSSSSSSPLSRSSRQTTLTDMFHSLNG